MLKKNNSQAFYLEAKKSLGQNFLKDESVISKIVSCVNDLSSIEKAVHEIGPGSGALTKPMLEKGMKVTGLEKDIRAIDGLQSTLGQEYPDKLCLIETDILKFDPGSAVKNSRPVCVGNMPYYITSDILLWFCNYKQYYTHGIFMVQNEVADRLKASARTKAYGRLSVKIQLNFEVEKLFIVPAACFMPKPKVDSAIVKLTPKTFVFPSFEIQKSFESFCAVLFSARRKMLRRVLQSHLQGFEEEKLRRFWESLGSFQVFEDTRPDAIPPESILKIFYTLVAKVH
jgi:16S rRNA (adenine1518-N6/adenine1519-N6)-dimethyltransferase